ncbi:probable (S)-N-methylcoclaurine 3'-hydroxylase isozyme 2 [Andrographis paniculata]|uniref:probable (S)-N-methylcoclaurine 3'-hydroxylase isozyme 2 n=1 Tax=Andrographis paniculata TaxID=175694 RepID=UPI0021E7BFB4|nr:probable (S)-N-methylcoclaurine 3'-hydroxylase isozyme 2 [Andrographis paniculata]
MIQYLLLLLLLLLAVLFFLHQLSCGPLKHLPPGPNPWQVLKTLHQFKDKPHVALYSLAKTYGPLISLRLGGQLIVVASSSAIAKEVLKIHDRPLSGRYLPSACYQVPGALSSLTMSRECNDAWKFLRAASHQSIFSSKAVDSAAMAGVRKERVEAMVAHLAGKLGEVVKLEEVVSMTVCNILTTVLASTDLMNVNDEDKIRVLVDEIVEMASAPGLSDLVPALKSVDFWSKANGVKMQGKMRRVWQDVVGERRRRPRSGVVLDFLDVLVQNDFLDDQISIILTELLIAGTDSTIITVTWLIVELIRNPQILSKVRLEIAESAIEEDGSCNGSITFDESRLSNCEYFQACIKETLRLHIPGPFLVPHRAIEACRVRNYIVPKDSIVLVNAWAIHLDPETWKDASSFRPDRFLLHSDKIDFVGPDLEFLPFGAGRRMCPGYHLGFRNVQLVVASLIHCFDWSLPGGENPKNLDIADKFVTTLKREKPLYLIPRIRENYAV